MFGPLLLLAGQLTKACWETFYLEAFMPGGIQGRLHRMQEFDTSLSPFHVLIVLGVLFVHLFNSGSRIYEVTCKGNVTHIL